MHKDAWRVEQQVRTAWTGAIQYFRQISQSADVLPRTAGEIFALDQTAPANVIKFLIAPTVFHISERASRAGPNLFVVVSGWLSFEGPDFRQHPLRTSDFGTQVAYFRTSSNSLDHIFGAHYDMDESDYRHPVFHAQLHSYAQSADHVRNLFSRNQRTSDHMRNVFRTARIPTAQMDIFSVLVQISADHLIGQRPAPATTTAFGKLKDTVGFMIGAGHKASYLNSPPASTCYRAIHWYHS